MGFYKELSFTLIRITDRSRNPMCIVQKSENNKTVFLERVVRRFQKKTAPVVRTYCYNVHA